MTPRAPDGWLLEKLSYSEQYILRTPDGLMATIDFEKRCFRAGLTTSGSTQGPKQKPSGRGWQQVLVDAAVAWLNRV